MDTISRENNSMLPVGGIIVGVIGMLLGGYATIKLANINRTLAAQEERVARIDAIESQTGSAAAAADKATRDLSVLTRSTQDAFNSVGAELGNLRNSITKIEESAKAAPVRAAKSGAPVTAGDGEYIIKSGDTFTKIATALGVKASDIVAVNPGVDPTHLKVGQKIKLPKK